MFRLLCTVLILWGGFIPSVSGQELPPDQAVLMTHPGILIITAGQDSTAGFHWQKGPGLGRISLVWDGGVLSIPDTLALEGYPNFNLGIPIRKGFFGSGKNGALEFVDGIYGISEDLMMSDGLVQLMVSRGELEIHGPRIRYSFSQTEPKKQVANYLLTAGLLILIAVLLRRARKKLRESG